MKNRTSFLLLLTGLIIFLVACSLSGGSKTTQEASTQPPAAPLSSTPASPDLPAPTDEPQPQPVRGTGDFDLSDPAVGLDGLHSYRQTLQTSFKGTINSEQQESQTALTREFMDDPAADLTWIETDDQGVQFFGSAGGLLYSQLSPESPCSSSPEPAPVSQPMPAYPFAALPPIAGGTFVDEVDVNGVPAKHYTFDERAIGFTSPAKAQGEVWIASSGGYVVRYTLTLEGFEDQLGPGVKGVQSWLYDLSEVNAGSTGLPEDCLPPESNEEFPLLEGAVMLLDRPGYRMYQAPGSVEAAVAFYQEQAEALGWSAGTPVVFGSLTRLALRPGDGSLVQLTFEMVDDSLTMKVQSLAPSPEE